MPEKLLPRFEIQALFYIIFLLFTDLLQAQVYITPSGAGIQDGSSWTNAYPGTQLQNAITTAPAGSQLWVSAGTYLPNALPPGSTGGVGVRSYAFALNNGVVLYGGFAGTETSLAMRNVVVNTTILSGDIGVPGNTSDNCYHVVLAPGTDNTAILDGFTITGGNANGPSSGWSISFGGGAISATPDAGAGLFCLAGTSSLINNCTFLSNNADAGAGCYCFTNTANFANCSFISNKATTGGGMCFLYSNATLTNCSFTKNTASSCGGGVYSSISTCAFTHCDFFKDSAVAYGGGFYNLSSSSPVIDHCSFSNNNASGGGALYNNGGSNPSVYNSSFSFNTAQSGGAVMNTATVTPYFLSCDFTANYASDGGAMDNSLNGNPHIANCHFYNNTATDPFGGGGALSNGSCIPIIDSCLFSADSATGSNGRGGAIYNAAASPVVRRCVFYKNVANGNTGNGGAIENESSSNGQFVNCLILQNTAVNIGGGVYNTASTPSFINCTVYGNTASNGAGFYNYSNANATLTNMIIFANTGGGIRGIRNVASTPVVTYSLVQNGLYAGTGNLNATPLFVNTANPIGPDNAWGTADDGLMLTCLSPGINAGKTVSNPVDITGTARPQGIAFDMGAYEQTITPSLAADSAVLAAPLCAGTAVQLSVSGGSLGSNAAWNWYAGSCCTLPIGTGTSISIVPPAPAMYYVRAVGNCNTTAADSIWVNISSCSLLYGASIHLQGSLPGNTAQLAWTTTGDLPDGQFVIERSTDAVHFIPAGEVAKTGIVETGEMFRFADNIAGIASPLLYYRVQLPIDHGISIFSQQVVIHQEPATDFTVMPSGTGWQVTLALASGNPATAMVRVVDAGGRRLTEQKQVLVKGYNRFFVKSAGQLRRGIYIMEINTGKSMLRKEVILQK